MDPMDITGARWQLQLLSFRTRRKVLCADKPHCFEVKPGA